MKSPGVRLLLVCSSLFYGYFLHEADSAQPLTDRAALHLLRQSLAVRTRYWPPRVDPCSSWTGVTCRSRRVESLDLTGIRPIRGRTSQLAPEAILALTRLVVLNASRYPLRGIIPPTLGNVTSLSVLSLAGTGVSGRIPPGLGRLAHLTALDLSGNSLSGPITEELAELRNLTHLDLSSNSLSGPIPAKIAELRNLTHLDLSSNSLSGPIPAKIAELRNLTHLDLSSNSLSGPIPAKIAELRNLTYLNLSTNSLSGAIPTSLGTLLQLKTLILSNNKLSKWVPAELGGLSSLTSIDLSFNFLSDALPGDLFLRHSRLQSVKLSHNNLSSALPNSLWMLPQLVYLDVSFNNLTGVLQVDAVASNSSARGGVFNLSHNLFYGSITSEVSRVLQRYSLVDLSNNYFKGIESILSNTTSVSLNCFSSTPNQRSPADCDKFYKERGLNFVEVLVPNPASSAISSDRKRSWHWRYTLVAVVCGPAFLAVVILLALCLMRCAARSAGRKDAGINPAPSAEAASPSSPSVAVRVDSPAPDTGFTYQQLLKATSGFSSMNLIKHGHSGDLYHGVLEDEVEVVVKRIDMQVVRRETFLTELNFLDSASDTRLVPFLGSSVENDNEKLLVYKYMSNGDLSSVLHKKPEAEDDGLRSLDWIKRMKIAIGVAEALCFLHHESNSPLVHRDIEASSILLDDKYEVRLGSLSEICTQQVDVHQNVLTRMLRSSQTSGRGVSGSSTATCAYDIYCLGKVLLELVTGKLGISGPNNAATNKWLQDTQACIHIFDKELVSKIVDPSLIVDEDHMEEVWAMAVVAKSCLDARPSKRPLARHVLKALENPLKVVREVNYPSISSSRGSWYSAIVGTWWHSFSSLVPIRPLEENPASKHSAQDHSSSQRKMSREILPDPEAGSA